MPSSTSNSNEPAGPAPPRTGVAALVLTLVVLAGLVWAISPAHPHLQPAPLRPAPSDCPKLPVEFVPTNSTQIPGIPLEKLTKEQKYHALFRVNMEPCPCGCNLSIAGCLLEHPQCPVAKGLAEKIVAEETATKKE